MKQRTGTTSDWRELSPALDALCQGRIPFERFAELGRLWLTGAGQEEILLTLHIDELPD